MTTELKVRGSSIHPTNEQRERLIQAPLRARRERLGVTVAKMCERTGLSPATVEMYSGIYRRTSDVGSNISTLVKIVDALDYPITVKTFNEVLSIGGADLESALHRSMPMLRKWRREITEQRAASVGGPSAEAQPDGEDAASDGEKHSQPGANLTMDQAMKVFDALLRTTSIVSTETLVEELGRRDALEDVALAVAASFGWVVVR